MYFFYDEYSTSSLQHDSSVKKLAFVERNVILLLNMKILFYLRLACAMFIFGVLSTLIYKISFRSSSHQQVKYDQANINHMKYGLFNVNTWKEKLAGIVVSEIEEFQLTNSNKTDLKKHVEGQLNTLIDKLNEQIKESNKDSSWLKKKIINALVDVKEIKQGVPNYADTIVQEMTHEESQKKLKDVIKGRVSKYIDKTFEPQDMAEVNAIIQRSGKKKRDEAMKYLDSIVSGETAKLYSLAWLIIGLAVLLFLVSATFRDPIPGEHFLLCTGALILLLYAGVVCPMIDMVARISKFSFVLLGHPVEFNNQVVYFQSKSIIDVFWILMDHKELPMKIVGLLMILFSIVFPAIKILCSVFYYYNIGESQKNGLVQFFVLKSGKWSMTDVQIVAIMMAYIGFNGMVTTQLEAIRATLPKFDLISTNDTTLQIGFYIFLCYVILSMLLSVCIEKKNIKS